MEERSVVHDTFVLEREYSSRPERVFLAFSRPETKKRWFGEGHGHDLLAFEMDFRVGGSERADYRFNQSSPFPGVALRSDAVFQDIVINRRIVMASTMTIGDHRMSAALASFEFLQTAKGTKLVFTHQGAFFEGSDGPAMRKDGWTKLLDQLDAEVARVAE